MSTTIRANTSNKNPYHISKHRYYELKHFCLQYHEWESKLTELYLQPKSVSIVEEKFDENIGHPTEILAIERVKLEKNLKEVEQAAIEADPDLYRYIFIAVTEGVSYEFLYTKEDIPCSRETYYNRYRKFFYILDKVH